MLNTIICQEPAIVIVQCNFEGNSALTKSQIKNIRENLRTLLIDKIGVDALLSEDAKQNNRNAKTYYLDLDIEYTHTIENSNIPQSIYAINAKLKRNEKVESTSLFYKELDVFIDHLKTRNSFLSLSLNQFIKKGLGSL